MRNLFGGKENILLRASIIAKHSAVNDDVVGGRLLEKEMRNSGIKNEYPAERRETEPSVKIRMKVGKSCE